MKVKIPRSFESLPPSERDKINEVLTEEVDSEEKDCSNCAFYNEGSGNQPCCYCVDRCCWERGEEDERR